MHWELLLEPWEHWTPGKSFAAPEQSGSPCALGTPTPAQAGHTSHSAAGPLERQEAAG